MLHSMSPPPEPVGDAHFEEVDPSEDFSRGMPRILTAEPGAKAQPKLQSRTATQG